MPYNIWHAGLLLLLAFFNASLNNISDLNTQTDKMLASRAPIGAKKKIFIRRLVSETVSDGGNSDNVIIHNWK